MKIALIGAAAIALIAASAGASNSGTSVGRAFDPKVIPVTLTMTKAPADASARGVVGFAIDGPFNTVPGPMALGGGLGFTVDGPYGVAPSRMALGSGVERRI